MDFIDERDRAAVEGDIADALASAEEPPRREVRVVAARGETWVRLTLTRAFQGGLILGLEDITDARGAEEQARLLQAAWSETIQCSPIAVVVSRVPSGPIIEVNEAYERLRGIPRQELIGQSQATPPLFVDERDRQAVLGQIAETGRCHLGGVRVRRRGGEVRVVDGHAVLVTVRGEALMVSFLVDVTEKARTIERLEARANELRLAFELAPVGIVHSDLETGRRMVLNDRFVKMIGIPREELLAKPLTEITHPDDRHLDLGAAERLRSGESVEEHYEKRFLRGDGSVGWADVRVAPLGETRGGQVIVVATDITDQKEAEARAHAAERTWAATVEALASAVAVTDMATSELLAVNPAFERLYGYRREEVLGRRTADLGLAMDGKAREALVERIEREGSLQFESFHVRTKQGEERILDGTATPADLFGRRCLLVVLDDVTDRRRAEAALERRAEAVQRAFASAPVGIAFTLVSQGRFFEVNDRMVSLLGYSREELLQMSIIDFTHPDDRQRDGGTLVAFARGELHELSIPKRFIHKSGAIVECEVRVTAPVRGDDGERYTVAAIHDLTEVRRAEALRREADARWTSTLKASSQPMAVSSLKDFTVLEVNPAAERLLGLPRAELVGQGSAALTREIERPATGPNGAQHLRDGRFTSKNVRVRTADGTEKILDLTSVRVVYEGMPSLLTLFDDVTERHRAEAELIASEARYRELVEDLSDPIVSFDTNGTITFANRAFSRFGHGPGELVGGRIEALLPGAMDRWRDVVTGTGTLPPSELIILDGKGRARTVMANPRPTRRDGVVVGLTTALIDLTAQREADERLRAAQRMEAIGRLAGGVAHDFNNLLTVMLSYTELSRVELPEDAEVGPYLDEVISACRRGEGLTRQLLAFSRKQVMDLVTLAVSDVVGGVSTMLRRLIGEDIRVETRVSDHLPLVKADRGQLEQVLMNLAVNARDAMPDGGLLEVVGERKTLTEEEAMQLELAPGEYVALHVRDTGIGMDEATRARVFEPFFTTKSVGKGTGLGLSTVYGIVRQFGGGVALDTEPGRGTTFHVLLPAAPVQSAELPSKPAQPIRMGAGGETILVVEDDAAVRAVLDRVLGGVYRVIMAATPDEALRILRANQRQIDLVLSDVIMPGMNGRQLSIKMREIVPNLRVIFMSGYTDEAIEKYEVLHDHFLRKPFNLNELQTTIRAVLDE